LLQSGKKQISPKEKFIIAKQQASDRKPHEKYMKMMQMRQKNGGKCVNEKQGDALLNTIQRHKYVDRV
jgi:hypothetical protein